MVKAAFQKHTLQFKVPSGTSRGVLNKKDSWYIVLKNSETNNIGIGEASLIEGLSYDAVDGFELQLAKIITQINANGNLVGSDLTQWPAINFAIEMAKLDLANENECLVFPSDFTSGLHKIPINGLVWMGDFDFMLKQIDEKVKQQFTCIKLKIGAINFEEELKLIQHIRKRYAANDLMIRVDANGAFRPGDDALKKMEQLHLLKVHSIEQPIKPKQYRAMELLSKTSILPIALDEELIGVFDKAEQTELLQQIKPQFIILKPSLLGGFAATKKWIDIAANNKINWWITSALEGNIGLNAIAQFTATLNYNTFQGLGTGGLFTNNITSPLYIEDGKLAYNIAQKWQFNSIIKDAIFN